MDTLYNYEYCMKNKTLIILLIGVLLNTAWKAKDSLFFIVFLAIWNLKDVDVEALGDEEFVTANLQGGRASNQRRVDREFNEEQRA